MTTFWFTLGAFVSGLVSGWFLNGKYGYKAQAEVRVAEDLAKKL